MDQLIRFINDPFVAPLWAVGVISVATAVLTIYRAARAGRFSLTKVPQILDTLVVARLLPLGLLGFGAVTVTDSVTRDALTVAYLGGATAAAASEAKQLIDAVLGRAEQDGAS